MFPSLPVGKVDLLLLESLLKKYVVLDERVVVGPRIGEDAAVIDFGDRYLVATTDPITFATEKLGYYALHINANDLAVRGAVPRWFLATLLLPEKGTTEEVVEGVFAQIWDACRALGISWVGGHTEVTYGLDRPIIVGQMLGEVGLGGLVSTAGAQVGDVVLLTKGIPIEGTSLIARERREVLKSRGYTEDFLARAQDYLYDPGISVLKEALLAVRVANVHAMHDPTEGGLATGLYELAQAAGVGLRIQGDAIPILPEGLKLLEEFNLNPLGTIASGALLLTCSPEQGRELLEEYEEQGIKAAIIGEVIPPEEGLRLVKGGEEAPLPYFPRDEIAKLFEQ